MSWIRPLVRRGSQLMSGAQKDGHEVERDDGAEAHQRARRDVVAPAPQQDQSGDTGRRRRKGQLLRQHDGVVGVEAGHEDEDQDEVDPAEPGRMGGCSRAGGTSVGDPGDLLSVRFLAADSPCQRSPHA